MDRLSTILIWASALGALVMAGVFFAFSNFIMPALARIAPSQGMPAMQSINITVLNPLFLLTFVGTGALLAILVAMMLYSGNSVALFRIAAAAAIYVFLSIGVTMAFNVPLNTALAQADALGAEGAALWTQYLREWTWWNHIRTMASLIAGALLISVF